MDPEIRIVTVDDQGNYQVRVANTNMHDDNNSEAEINPIIEHEAEVEDEGNLDSLAATAAAAATAPEPSIATPTPAVTEGDGKTWFSTVMSILAILAFMYLFYSPDAWIQPVINQVKEAIKGNIPSITAGQKFGLSFGLFAAQWVTAFTLLYFTGPSNAGLGMPAILTTLLWAIFLIIKILLNMKMPNIYTILPFN